MKYMIAGVVCIGDMKMKFTKEIDAKSEKHARDKLYALFGSSNRTKRSKIKIDSVQEGE